MEQTITSMMDEKRVFTPKVELSSQAEFKTLDDYRKAYKESIENPEKYWAKVAENLVWHQKWTKVVQENFAEAQHEWFIGGKLNVSEKLRGPSRQGWQEKQGRHYLGRRYR
jgi:acetyl-CoA synthetase